MKKKRKAYIAHVSKARSSRAVMRDLAIGFVANRDRLELINVKSNRIEKCGPSIDASMSKIRHKWIVYLGAMGRNKLGKKYIKIDEAGPDFEVYKHQISKSCGDAHKILADSVPANQLSNVGWIATPTGHELSEEHLYDLFSMMGCWDNLAPWQRDVIAEHEEIKRNKL